MKKHLCLISLSVIFSFVFIPSAPAQILEVEASPINVKNNPSQWQELAYADSTSQVEEGERESAVDQEMNRISFEESMAKSESSSIDDESIDPSEAANNKKDYVSGRPVPNPKPQVSEEYIGSEADMDILNRAESTYGKSQGQKVSPASSDLAIMSKKPEFGLELQHNSYKEPIFDLEIKGLMYGIFGAYTFRPYDNQDPFYNRFISMFRAEGRINVGIVDYDSAPSGTADDITDYSFEIRTVYGKDFYFGRTFLATPYFGLGLRYLNDDGSGKQSSSGDFGYERESRYIYVPLGVELTQGVSEKWLVTFTGEYDFLVDGQQKSHLSDVSFAYPDITNDQDNGYGSRVSVRLTHLGESMNFFIEPYFRYWHIEDSDITTATGPGAIVTGLEPENSTKEFGLRVGTQF